jgi:hypothetical protein
MTGRGLSQFCFWQSIMLPGCCPLKCTPTGPHCGIASTNCVLVFDGSARLCRSWHCIFLFLLSLSFQIACGWRGRARPDSSTSVIAPKPVVRLMSGIAVEGAALALLTGCPAAVCWDASLLSASDSLWQSRG